MPSRKKTILTEQIILNKDEFNKSIANCISLMKEHGALVSTAVGDIAKSGGADVSFSGLESVHRLLANYAETRETMVACVEAFNARARGRMLEIGKICVQDK